jgi:hypothetical protein
VPPEEFLTPPDYLLMQREFDTPDPEGLPGLVEELPAGAAVRNIHYRYDVTPLRRALAAAGSCMRCRRVSAPGRATALWRRSCGSLSWT